MAGVELPAAVALEVVEPLVCVELRAESNEAVAAAVAELGCDALLVATADACGCAGPPDDDVIARTPKYPATAITATSAVMAPTMIGVR